MMRSPSHDSTPRHMVLLPGMHGTGELFLPFRKMMPAGFQATVLELPNEPLSYSNLQRLMEPRLPRDVPFVLLGESFSGPLAIRLAAKRPPNLRGLILCNSFVSPPRAPFWKMLPWTTLFRIPPPNLLLRRYLTGNDAPTCLLADIRRALTSVPPQILASRLRTALTENAHEALGQCVVPMLCLRGTKDRLVSARASRTMEKIAPSIRRREVTGPHLLIQVNPKEVWQAITDFITTICTA